MSWKCVTSKMLSMCLPYEQNLIGVAKFAEHGVIITSKKSNQLYKSINRGLKYEALRLYLKEKTFPKSKNVTIK